jgi:hypothetical protein
MRASSLSNAAVISLLNRFFVPVYVSNEDYRKDGPAPADERAEYQRIYREALKAKLSTGTVHAYVLTPDGHPFDSLHVAQAAKVEELRAMLERAVAKLKTPEGAPLVRPAPQSVAPRAEADALVLHLTARTLLRKGDDYVPRPSSLGQTRSAGWGSYPQENWIVLPRPAWAKLLPAGAVAVGASWEPDRETAARILTYFYPSTENNNVARNRIDRQELKATVLAVEGGVVRARLDGSLRMKHPFYHKDDDNFVEATVVGVLEFEPGKGIRTLELVTDRATYGRTIFGVAVRQVH